VVLGSKAIEVQPEKGALSLSWPLSTFLNEEDSLQESTVL